MERHWDFQLTILWDKSRRWQYGGYKYLVRSRLQMDGYHYPHTAFHTKEGLKKWMKERGIKFDKSKRMPFGKYSFYLCGEYYDEMLNLSVKDFETKFKGKKIIHVMSNGNYTQGRVTRHKGKVAISYLNPNVRDRKIYDRRNELL